MFTRKKNGIEIAVNMIIKIMDVEIHLKSVKNFPDNNRAVLILSIRHG